jgi:hypothetical protein
MTRFFRRRLWSAATDRHNCGSMNYRNRQIQQTCAGMQSLLRLLFIKRKFGPRKQYLQMLDTKSWLCLENKGVEQTVERQVELRRDQFGGVNARVLSAYVPTAPWQAVWARMRVQIQLCNIPSDRPKLLSRQSSQVCENNPVPCLGHADEALRNEGE